MNPSPFEAAFGSPAAPLTTDDQGHSAQALERPDGKLEANFFVAVRDRGMVNAMMETPAKVFEKANPDLGTKWVYSPTNGENSLVVPYEAMGFAVVKNKDVRSTESGSNNEQPVRVGDMVLMCAPWTIIKAMLEIDAKAAKDDIKAPERAYRENLESRKVHRSDGQEDYAKPVGSVKETTEWVRPTKAMGGD